MPSRRHRASRVLFPPLEGARPVRRRQRLLPCLAGVCPLSGSAALASSPEAWNRYDRQVRTACVAASGLADVRVRGARIDLPALGLSSLLLEGRYPQPHMNGRPGLELCVFEQRSGRAVVAEADSLRPALAAETQAPAGSRPAPQGGSPLKPPAPAGSPASPMAPR